MDVSMIAFPKVHNKKGNLAVIENDIISKYVAELVNVIKPIGPTNIQIRLEDQVPYLLEINPRISSACSLRTSFGYNEPEMCVLYFLMNQNLKDCNSRI